MDISIDNFSIDIGDVAYCTSLLDFSVDVLDPTYAITVSGTYFVANGLVVPSILGAIPGGYRMTYSTTPSGNISLVANASNANGEYFSRTFGLQYGYEASWEAVNYWGPLREVPVVVTVSNSVLAPNTTYFSTFFRTKNFETYDLGAEITAEGSGNLDISAYTVPQSKYFLQGKTYTVTISGIRDFSGNVLDAVTYSFIIDDNTN